MFAVHASAIVPGTLGAFASQAVPQGGIIERERPRFLSAPTTAVDRLRHNERYAWSMVESILQTYPSSVVLRGLHAALVLDRYATGLAGVTWEAEGDSRALALLTASSRQPPDVVRALYDIMCTNAIVASTKNVRFLVEGMAQPLVENVPNTHGFFPRLSRVNHACDPNATLQFPLEAGQPVTLVALRAIAADEEITMSYLGNKPASRVELLANFGFRCACLRCRHLCSWLACAQLGSKSCPCKRAAYCGVAHQKADWARHAAGEHAKK